MNWTNELPTKEGYYWAKWIGTEDNIPFFGIVYITTVQNSNEMVITGCGTDYQKLSQYSKDDFVKDVLFLGPLEEPK